ncbi:hypothetical protein C6501_15585 [Candidatus Poribacteria bacterium]|nr:MAG: hypothetical protein C6501_15585 [Candidatus Poribacteria bacterium]
MTIRIDTLIFLLMIIITLLIGCSVAGQKTAIEPKPTADYIGDPYLWIPDIEYMITVVLSRQKRNVSYPVISPEKQKRLREIFLLDLTKEQKDLMKIEILVEGLSDLDAAKYLLTSYHSPNVSRKTLDGYTQLYAQKALDKTPNDFTTLYVWTAAHPLETTALPIYRKLLKMMPNSKHVLHRLANYLYYHYRFSGEKGQGRIMIEEAVDFLTDEQHKEIYIYLCDLLR